MFDFTLNMDYNGRIIKHSFCCIMFLLDRNVRYIDTNNMIQAIYLKIIHFKIIHGGIRVSDYIEIKGAKIHNLKKVDVKIP
ncbi:MAG: hypothetical protein K0S47_2344, partial [Herbinix sp.]|nr:hypothetical protein [Herbinix sp.]